MTDYSKEYIDTFSSKVLSNFLIDLKKRGLKFKDTTFQKNFLMFVTESLKVSLAKAFLEVESINKK